MTTDAEKANAVEIERENAVDRNWSPSRLMGVGIVTLIVALSIIVFMATRLTTCMYLDGSH